MSMDDKDLKRIEDQIEQTADEVEVPEALKPENIKKTLDEKAKQKKYVWKPAYGIAAAAACCAIVVGIAAFGGAFGNGEKGSTITREETDKTAGNETDTSIHVAADYEEVYSYIEAEQKIQEAIEEERKNDIPGGLDINADTQVESATGSVAEGSTADSVQYSAKSAEGEAAYSDTNVRQEGVGEGDFVKTDGKNLYILNGQKVQIVNIEDKEMKELGSIRLDEDQFISEMYVKDGKLLLVYTRTEYKDGEQGYEGVYKQYTVAETYDINNPKEPKSLGKITQSGNYNTMRIVGEYVYVLSSFYVDTTVPLKDTGEYIPQVQGKILESSDIILPQYNRGNQYTVMAAFSLNNPDKKVDSKAVFGGTGLVYASGSNMYICEGYYNSAESKVTQTCIRKVSYKDGKLEAVGQTKINGILNNSFSIDEFEGNLRLVTTVSPSGNGGVLPLVQIGTIEPLPGTEQKDTNSLYVLDENLKELGKIEGLAEDERVYSARFMGNTGYFVTFKQVDPLFSVDLSDPKNPEIIGALKIPGFSDYLHPYGEGLLVGIGVDVEAEGTASNGVKLSMFDISNPADVTEIQKYVIEDIYYTNIGFNYKAALVNPEKNLIGFAAQGQGQHYYVFSYDEEKGFQLRFDRELSGYGEGRGVFVGETFYVIAGNTVESFTMDAFEKIDDIVL